MGIYDNNLFYISLCMGSVLLQVVWVKLLPENASEIQKDKRTLLVDVLFCVCTAFAVSTLFRLFPGNNRLPTEDSSVFLYIGKRMTEGKIPYRDLFDHKGPVLYFIEYLGILVSETGYSGVWLLEVLNILTTVFLMLKLGKSVSDRSSNAFLAVLVCVGACGWRVWQGGNFTEEYALPWITLAAIAFYSFFQTGLYRWNEIMLLGVGFMIVFLLRANMIAIWVALMPVVLVLFIKEKRYFDTLKCMFLFLIGAAIVILPILFYAMRTKSLEAMWQNYIVFNLSYTNGAASISERLRLLLFFVRALWPGTIAMIIALLNQPKNRVLWANLLFFVVSLIFVTLSGRGYYHYAIILLPAFILPFTVLFGMTDKLLRGGDNLISRPSVIIASSLLILLAALIFRGISTGPELYDPLAEYIQKQTAEDDDVLILGNSCWYYLMTERKTENRFFYQLPPAEISAEIYDGFIKELTEHPSKLVVLPGVSVERESIDISLKGIREKLFENGYINDITKSNTL